MSDYLTATQAAERLGTSLTNVARWCRDGTLPATRLGIGRIWRIPVEAVEAFTPPARGPKPGAERKRLLDLAKEIIAEFVKDPFGEIKQPGWDFMTKELAQQGHCTRARARQALSKAIRMAKSNKDNPVGPWLDYIDQP